MTTKKFVVYLVAAFVPAWALQALAILSMSSLLPSGPSGPSDPSPSLAPSSPSPALEQIPEALIMPLISQGLVALSMFVPLLAVLIACRGLGLAKSGIRWGLHLKGRLRWVLAAWLGPVVLTLFGATLYFACFPRDFMPSGGLLASTLPPGTEPPFPLELLLLISLGSALIMGPVINTFFAVGEEAGWRGFMVPFLMKKLGRIAGQIVGGVIWGAWHWPLIIFTGYEYGTGYPGEPFLGMACMCLFATTVGILLQFLYERSQTIWVPALAHGAINACAATPLLVIPAQTTSYLLGPAPAGLLALLPTLLLAAVVLLRKNTAEGDPQHQPPPDVPATTPNPQAPA
jgi:membrane protease YdiL (CAAX protease family)